MMGLRHLCLLRRSGCRRRGAAGMGGRTIPPSAAVHCNPSAGNSLGQPPNEVVIGFGLCPPRRRLRPLRRLLLLADRRQVVAGQMTKSWGQPRRAPRPPAVPWTPCRGSTPLGCPPAPPSMARYHPSVGCHTRRIGAARLGTERRGAIAPFNSTVILGTAVEAHAFSKVGKSALQSAVCQRSVTQLAAATCTACKSSCSKLFKY